MTQRGTTGITREFIRAYRYEMTLEVLQLLLTDAGWLKADLAFTLDITYDELNQLLSRQYYPANNHLMRQVRKLYRQKYGRITLTGLDQNKLFRYFKRRANSHYDQNSQV